MPAVTEPAQIEDQRTTPLELFFDLVFVFAITQVTAFITKDPGWERLIEGMAVLAALWFAWVAYAWLENRAASDEGPIRMVLLLAIGAMFAASLAVPGAFGDDGLAFGIAYLVVRLLHLLAYAYLARDDPELRGVVARLASTMVPAALLLVLAGALDGTPRGICWAAALTLDYGGLAMRGVEGWAVRPGHFAERHGLIVIIALGESIIAIGVGVSGLGFTGGVVTAALLGGAVAAGLWWTYFDFVSLVGEHNFRRASPADQVRIARDSYTYLHLPMVAGIVLFAAGVKVTLEHSLADHVDELDAAVATALTCGVAMYLIALSAFRRRNVGSWNRQRLLAAAILICLTPLATVTPAWLALALVTVVVWTLVGYETLRWADFRDRARHGGLT
jgi:low temperature requirement protein LtrA